MYDLHMFTQYTDEYLPGREDERYLLDELVKLIFQVVSEFV
jgi:hypothetical protein